MQIEIAGLCVNTIYEPICVLCVSLLHDFNFYDANVYYAPKM